MTSNGNPTIDTDTWHEYRQKLTKWKELGMKNTISILK